ncbi:MAG TPA: GAF domain-containing sensor histidine kinase, partial [Ramlibacter sp.]
PCDELVSVACTAASLLAGAAQDYRGAHAGTSHVIAVGEARGLVTGTAAARLTHSLSVAHWRDPIETALALFRRTREDLLRLGNTRTASYTYVASDLLLDCAPTLHEAVAEVDAGLALAAGVASEDYTRRYLPRRQLLRALRGTTHAPGGFSDDEFDEAAYVQQLAGADTTSATYHITATITAAIFGDRPAWARHAAAAMPMQARTPGYYLTAVLRTLHAVSLAEACRYLPLEERSTQLGEIDTHAQWLRGRAADAAQNFAHLLAWVEAERAWSAGSVWETGAGFDRARASAAEHRRPWHAALITERAAYFHMEQGLETSGRLLLAEARDRYDAWGAEGKVRELERAHPVLRARTTPREQGGRRGPERAATGWEAIDLMAVIRASQSLSSETNLAQLQDRVTQVLSAITGATHVQLALWQEDAGGWMLPAPAAEDAAAASIPLAEAAARGLVPVTAFRYAERTRQALLVEDACRDDRFSEDPYLRGLERCSLLLVPILSQGAQRAMLLLENRLGAKAFSAERLDAVTLIAGQLAVSLENALLYRELEQRVQERTQQLRRAQAELVGTARRAGMAEIATNVLHNVGNVLNSVNVSADLAAARLRSSRAKGLARAAEMLRAHTHDLAAFLTTDDKGRLLPAYLVTVSDAIAAEQREILEELGNLTRSVGHIKDVVATQQSHAGASSLIERADLTVLVEDALRINSILLERAQVRVVREFEAVPPADLDKTRVMQILVNLVRNAVQAMESSPTARALTVTLGRAGDATRVAITDSGVGIPADNITRIFAHGFTT